MMGSLSLAKASGAGGDGPSSSRLSTGRSGVTVSTSARAASSTTVVSTRLTAAGRSATGIRTTTGTTAFAGASGAAGYYGYSPSSAGAGGGVGYAAAGSLSSPTSRAAKPTLHTEPLSSPTGSEAYESDVSQGDHLLQARDRSKRSPSTCRMVLLLVLLLFLLLKVYTRVHQHVSVALLVLSWHVPAHAPSPLARGTISGPSSARLR
jgi:hypothetical protein